MLAQRFGVVGESFGGELGEALLGGGIGGVEVGLLPFECLAVSGRLAFEGLAVRLRLAVHSLAVCLGLTLEGFLRVPAFGFDELVGTPALVGHALFELAGLKACGCGACVGPHGRHRRHGRADDGQAEKYPAELHVSVRCGLLPALGRACGGGRRRG